MLWLELLGIFLAYVVLDFAWARYLLDVSHGRALPAMAWSAGITVLSAVTFISFVTQPVLIVAAAAGAAIGTMWGMRLK